MVEDVEELTAKLQLEPFGHWNHFERREIQVRSARPS